VTPQPTLAAYTDELVARIADVVEVVAAYLLGSGAYGGFEAGVSDVDVVAVAARALTRDEKDAVVAAAEAVPCPGRKLELVVYAAGHDEYELNLNTGERVSFDPAGDPGFWSVLDRAIAAEHAVTLVGPPWNDVFAPVDRGAILDALDASLDWHEREEPHAASGVLNACRAWRWVEEERWSSKPEAATWLRGKVRGAIEAAR
jgi:predicted nucleotidyltransferase